MVDVVSRVSQLFDVVAIVRSSFPLFILCSYFILSSEFTSFSSSFCWPVPDRIHLHRSTLGYTQQWTYIRTHPLYASFIRASNGNGVSRHFLTDGWTSSIGCCDSVPCYPYATIRFIHTVDRSILYGTSVPGWKAIILREHYRNHRPPIKSVAAAPRYAECKYAAIEGNMDILLGLQ